MSVYEVDRDQQQKVFIVTATRWLKWQSDMLFRMEHERQVYRPFNELGQDDDSGGVTCICHSQLLEIPKEVLARSLVIVDEGHLLLPQPKSHLVKPLQKLWEASRVLFLSATFGDALGLDRIKRHLAKVTPFYKTIFVRPEGMGPADKFSKINLTTLKYRDTWKSTDANPGRLPTGMLQGLVAAMIKKWTDHELPTVIVAPTAEHASHLHTRLSLYLNQSRTESKSEKKILRTPRLFTGEVDPSITSVFEQIHKGATDDTRVIITSYATAIGVNFWPRCFLCSTHIPWSIEVWDQCIGRCDRQDPNGMRFVAWPQDA